MKQTISEYWFRNAFQDIRPNNFTYEGLTALYDYLIEWEEDLRTELELDVIALCCDFSEYANFEELQKDYDVDNIEELEGNTSIIWIDEDRFIIQVY